jgi:uncharacterized membrane protein HdeD (DUF308 family)
LKAAGFGFLVLALGLFIIGFQSPTTLAYALVGIGLLLIVAGVFATKTAEVDKREKVD